MTQLDYFLFIDTDSKKDAPVVLEPYSFSTSLSNSYAYNNYDVNLKQYALQVPEAIEIGGDPWKWDVKTVSTWLTKCGLEKGCARFEQEDIDGAALSMITSDDANKLFEKESVGFRLRVYRALSHLRNYGDELGRMDQYKASSSSSSNRSVHMTFNASSQTIALMPFLLEQDRHLPRVTLMCYHRRDANNNGGGWGRRGGRNERQVPESVPNGTPFYMMQMTQVAIESYSESGSSGGGQPNVSLSFRYKGHMVCHYLGVTDIVSHTYAQLRQFMGLTEQEAPDSALAEDPFLLSPGVSVEFDPKSETCSYFEWGKHQKWSPKSHTLFPKEFRVAASTFFKVWRTKNNPLGVVLPHNVGTLIIQTLANDYANVSPFRDFPHPDPQRLVEAAADPNAQNGGW